VAPGTRPLATDLDEQTELGDVYLEGLMRAQLRLSVSVLGVLVLAVAGFSLLLLTVPAARTAVLFGLPFPWLVLGVAVYPATWLAARTYVRQAERIEAEFTDVVSPVADPS
jgi:pilus assembly protein TadC